MLEKVEKMLWMLLLAPAIAPARNCSDAPGQVARHGSVDDVRVRAVVAGRAEQREQRAGPQAAARQPHVLVVDLVGEPRVLARKEAAQSEQLQLLGGFLARAEHAQVIELPPHRRLPDVQRVAEKREVALAQERGHHRDHQHQQQPRREPQDARPTGSPPR